MDNTIYDLLISPLSEDNLTLDNTQEKIKQYLIDEDVIEDVEYDGSNIAILVKIISYMVYNITASHALNANQTTLLLSDIRQNIVYLAQQQGYNPSRRVSAKMSVTLSAILSTNEQLVIPKWTSFNCGDYIFLASDNITLTEAEPTLTVDLLQGQYIDSSIDATLKQVMDETNDFVILNYTNIENDNVYLKIKKYSSELFSDYYTRKFSLLDFRNNKNFFVEKQDAETEYIKLYTSFIGQGQSFNVGDEYDISFVLSDGIEANGIVECTLDNVPLTNLDNEVELNITVNSASRGGQDRESNESIKNNTPLFYNTGNRTVTETDYEAFLNQNSLVKESVSIGGESVLPAQLGHIFLSVIPADPDLLYIPSNDEATLIEWLNDARIISTVRKFKHPNYFYMDFDVKLLGDVQDITTKKSDITNIIETYFNDFQNKFKAPFFQNRIISEVEDLFENEINSNITVNLQPKLLLSPELFTQTFVNDRIHIYIPNSPKKFYLFKDGNRIDVPENEEDIDTYLINGWTKKIDTNEDLDISFSGIINNSPITLDSNIETIIIYPVTCLKHKVEDECTEPINPDDGIEYEKQNILINGIPFGYYIKDLNILSLDNTVAQYLTGTNDFINIDYSPAINVNLENTSIITLGDIVYT